MSRTTGQVARRALLVGALVLGVGAGAVAVPASAEENRITPQEPGIGQQVVTTADLQASATITRSEVLKRAHSWVQASVPYSQFGTYTNEYGTYRRDCSGFISMAWGLSPSGMSSPTTWTLPNYSTWLNSLDDLKPGDAIDEVNSHVVLFVRWTDASRTAAVVYESTSFGGPEGPYPGAIERTWSRSSLESGGYRPLRYNGIVDDANPVTSGVRSVVTTSDGSQLFGVGPDGHVVSTFWSGSISTNGGWHDWFTIPTGYADGVAAPNASVTFTKINGRMQLFTTASNGYVISTFWDPSIPTNGGWHEWFAIPTGYGDGKSSGVVTATTINGQPQLFTTAPDGHVISTFWSGAITSNGGWHSWFAIPTGFANGKTATNATVTATTINGQPQLFTTAPDGQVMSTFWSGSITTNGGWREWFAIPTGFANGKASGNAVVTATTINGQPQLFTTAPDGQVMSTFWSGSIPTNGGWREWFAIPTGYANGKAGAKGAVTMTTINGQPQLFTTAPDGQVMSTFWSGSIPTNGGWREWFAVPTGYNNGQAATSARVGMIMLNNQPQLFTTAPNGYVISTFWSGSITTNGGWHEWFAIPTGHHDGRQRV
ncbi:MULTISPECIES: hypothetical protein [unclassified Saccharothrix]|uniref:hypothetical protein n=1 Tax=unclassified Saccharothrix TaxID=2593673 RepID=UPI00307DA47D